MSIKVRQLSDSFGRRKRPFGVNAIIVLSVLSVLYGLAVLFVIYYGTETEGPALVGTHDKRWVTLYFIVSTLFQPAIIVGLWRLKRWGWFLVMLHTGAVMFLNIWAYFYARPNYVNMAASVLIVLYMNQREVQQAFIESNKSVTVLTSKQREFTV